MKIIDPCGHETNLATFGTMQVLRHGQLETRSVASYEHHNGYQALAMPKLNVGEWCEWKAGSRVPEVLGRL